MARDKRFCYVMNPMNLMNVMNVMDVLGVLGVLGLMRDLISQLFVRQAEERQLPLAAMRGNRPTYAAYGTRCVQSRNCSPPALRSTKYMYTK